MDAERILVGTVRGARDGRHIVVRRDGKVSEVIFEGGYRPLIGGDVVGTVRSTPDGVNRMTLRENVLDIILEGRTRIFPTGARPDLTARILAKILSRSRSAVLAPGSGVSMERSPVSHDPDLAWAMAAFQPEAERLSIALNVIDVQAVAKAAWQRTSLRDLTLPADVEGSRRAMSDLSRLLRSGFSPDCNRMIEHYTGNHEISVNFVLPYSPFSGALGFAREVARMDAGTFPDVTMTMAESRRLSAARHVALALAHNRLGAGQGIQADPDLSDRTAHMAACFADAAASLAFLASGGRREAIEEYAALRQASLHFGYFPGTGEFREGVLVDATHRAIREALTARITDGMGAREIVSAAVRIARRTAFPSSRFTLGPGGPTTEEAAEAAYAAEAVGRDLRDASRSEVEEMAVRYRRDLRALVEEHSGSEESSARMLAFGSVHIPMRMSSVFEDETAPLPVHRDKAVASAAEEVAKRDRLAARIVARRPKPSDADAIEFGEPSPGM